jgi:hypothetical protein
MLYAFGVGEIPVSVSGITPTDQGLAHTVRAVGAVPRDLPAAQGRDLLIMAGGIRLAPLRPVVADARSATGPPRPPPMSPAPWTAPTTAGQGKSAWSRPCSTGRDSTRPTARHSSAVLSR